MPMPMIVVKVVACQKGANPTIEELSFRSVYQSAQQQMQEKALPGKRPECGRTAVGLRGRGHNTL